MSPSSKSREKDIFLQAISIESSEERYAFLADACADDSGLRIRVDALILAHEGPESLLDKAAPELSHNGIGSTAGIQESEKTGTQIGPYKLLQQIGEGGMGTVYMAEQLRPVRRKVALKVIKPGMDSDSVVARFEAERQALAMMNHPNIARVFDGGASEGGRPYFVMELVKGVPITEYCDKNELSTEQRLRLFTTVCQAVQHAHQKGIIHRDLKPSNVLVTLADGEPVVKVIDFGVAKATNQQLTEKTLFTAFGQMVGTPQYMSPEQAEMSCLDVDTRSDVYSLGVLLYELLTGTTPLRAQRLRKAGYAEMQRLIREEEPPKPSNRLSTSGEKLTIIAKHRKVTPEKLRRQVTGDLDWIVMRALEKDRSRRYESASRFADDLNRLLSGDAIEARPPTLTYRAGRVWNKNRKLILSLSTIFIAMLGCLLASLWALSESRQRMAEAEGYARVLDDWLGRYRGQLRDEALMYGLSGDLKRVDRIVKEIEALDLASKNDISNIDSDLLRAVAFLYRGEISEAKRSLEVVLQADSDNIPAMGMLAFAGAQDGDFEDCIMYNERIDELLKNREVVNHFDLLFAGQGAMPIDEETAIKRLHDLVDDRPYWALAKAALADVLSHNALEFSTNTKVIDDALRLVNEAEQLAPGVPFIETVSLWVHTVAINVYQRSNIDTSLLVKDGAKSSQRLVELPDYGVRRTIEFWFANLSQQSLDAKIHAAKKALDTSLYLWTPSVFLYANGESDFASKTLAEFSDENSYAAALRIRGELLINPSEVQSLVAELDRIASEDKQNPELVLDCCSIYSLLGRHERATSLANDLSSFWENGLPDGGWFAYSKQVEAVLADCDSEVEFRQLVENATPYQETVMAWQIGSRLIGLRDYQEARKVLAIAAESSFFNTGYKTWSKVYVDRLDDASYRWPSASH